MVPNINLTFKADHAMEDVKIRSNSRATTQWSNNIDPSLITNESGGRSAYAAYSRSCIHANLSETPSRAPFTAFNSKQLRKSALKVPKKKSTNLDSSKKGQVDSDRVYRALRFVKLDRSTRNAMQKGTVKNRSSKKAELEKKGDRRDLPFSTICNTVRLVRKSDDADSTLNKGDGRRQHVVSAASPLTFHGRKHNSQLLATTHFDIALAGDTSMNQERASSTAANETLRIAVTKETTKAQFDHGTREITASLVASATEASKSKPLSTMIKQPDILPNLLKQAERK